MTTQIVRIVTQDRVYFVGEPLPVPDGSPVEPFLITDIIWDEELDKIQFICTPDVDAARNPPERTEDMTDEQYAAMVHYHEQAKFAKDHRLLINAIISAEHARIESILNEDDYLEFLRQKAKEEEEDEAEADNEGEPDEPVELMQEHSKTQPAPAFESTPKQDEQLPAEVSVETD